MSNKVKAGGGINLAQGIPGFNPPDELLRILAEKSFQNVHQYAPGNGSAELVNQICRHYPGPEAISPDELLVVQGATEGFCLVHTYLNNKFGNNWASLAFDPVYESYSQLPRIFNSHFIRIPTGKGGELDRAKTEYHLSGGKVKLVCVNSPGNPLGKIWTEEEFGWIFSLAMKYDFYILLDAVYKDLFYGDMEPFIPLSMNRRRLFYINSFSKMLSITGWRVGYMITCRNIMKELRAIHDYTGLCAPSILQYSISDYLALNDYGREYVSNIRSKLSANYMFAVSELEKLDFVTEPAGGGYFIWCRLPGRFKDGVSFALELYDNQKVGVVPGIHFSNNASSWIRINIAREESELSSGLNRIAGFLHQN